MKKIIALISLVLLSYSSFAQTKVGTIDAEYILSQLPEMTQVNEGLKAYNEELQKNLEASIQEYETLAKDYQQNNATFTEEVKKKKEGTTIS